ncbi:zf-HC2 domain-containing protein [Labilibaculum sp. K2S]|uniref:anti-sigma factor family protein n=1 Tax=Labilibaculum sp. K2S TaxID=3056386 RepID=UPI0025A3ADBB|nr:zf-HC2 domain-containing protein [Labilibaculum sp. K2S]MDM8158411.1 zf-HC2 domain-containing protein [Labilibaculum sp. K2S]
MKCKEVNSKLIFYLEKELLKDEMLQVENHLSKCSSCSDRLILLQSAMGVIEKEKSLQANPYFLSKTLNRLREEQRRAAQPFIGLLKPALLGVLFLLAIGSGIFMGANFASDTETRQQSNLIDPYFNEIDNETIELFFLNDGYHE